MCYFLFNTNFIVLKIFFFNLLNTFGYTKNMITKKKKKSEKKKKAFVAISQAKVWPTWPICCNDKNVRSWKEEDDCDDVVVVVGVVIVGDDDEEEEREPLSVILFDKQSDRN